jgi:hypothetical protein
MRVCVLLQPTADRLQRICCQRREFRREPRPSRRWPAQHDTIHDRERGGRIAGQRQRLRDAENLTRRDVTDHNLVALLGALLDAQMPVQQHEQRRRLRALLEHGRTFRIPHRMCLAQNFVELGCGNPRK